jgi:hypothetical protein
MEQIDSGANTILPGGRFKLLNLLFRILFTLSLGYYTWFFLTFSIPDSAGLGVIAILPFYFVIALGLTVAYYFVIRAVQRDISTSRVRTIVFFGIGGLSMLYCIFAIVIFPNIGQRFSGELLAPSSVQLGDNLSYQLKPSEGFYTQQLSIPVALTKPDGSNVQSAVYFDLDRANPNCHLLFTLFYCIPVTQKGEFMETPFRNITDPTQEILPFQLDATGTYTLSSTNAAIKGATIVVTEPASGLSPVFANSAIIANIPGFTISHETQLIEDNGFVTFQAVYSSSTQINYSVTRSDASGLNAPAEVQEQGGHNIPYTLQSIATTTVVDGNKVLVSQSWWYEVGSPGIPQNHYYDQAYWLSGNALIEVTYNTGHLPDRNVYDSPVFRAYIKQYPSTM